MDWNKIILAVIAAVVALGAGGLVFTMRSSQKNRRTNSVRKVSQKNNTAGGDIVGGDKITKK